MATGVLRTLLTPAGFWPPGMPRPVRAFRTDLRDRGFRTALAARANVPWIVHSATFGFDGLRLLLVLAAAAYCVGTSMVRRELGVADAFLLGVALYLLLVHAGATADVRTRVQLEPILALYAARGLVALRPARRLATAR